MMWMLSASSRWRWVRAAVAISPYGTQDRGERQGRLLDVAEAAKAALDLLRLLRVVALRVTLELERGGVVVLGRARVEQRGVDRLGDETALQLERDLLAEEVEHRRRDVLDPEERARPARRRRPREGEDPLVPVAADVGVLATRLELDRVPNRLRPAGEVPLAEPFVLVELDQEVGDLLQLRPVEEVLAP